MKKNTAPQFDSKSKKSYLQPQQRAIKIQLQTIVALSNQRVRSIESEDDFILSEDGILYEDDR